MSSNVVELNSRRPHRVGPARCRGCGYEATTVSPIACEFPLECPKCHEFKFWYMGVLDPGDDRWQCPDCNNDLFYIGRDAVHCAFCGRAEKPHGWVTAAE